MSTVMQRLSHPGLRRSKDTGPADVLTSHQASNFSPVAVEPAGARAEMFDLRDRARFVVGDLAATDLPDSTADAAVCIDAMHSPRWLPRRRR